MWVYKREKRSRTYVPKRFSFMGAGGFEPPKLKSSRFTVCPHWPLGNTPRFNFQPSLTAYIFYHLKWYLSTTFSADFLIPRGFAFFHVSPLQIKTTGSKRPRNFFRSRVFLELVTGVERVTGIALPENSGFCSKIYTFYCCFSVSSCAAHTPTKSKVC